MYHFVEQISLAEDEHYLWINPEQQPIANISVSKAKQNTNKQYKHPWMFKNKHRNTNTQLKPKRLL